MTYTDGLPCDSLVEAHGPLNEPGPEWAHRWATDGPLLDRVWGGHTLLCAPLFLADNNKTLAVTYIRRMLVNYNKLGYSQQQQEHPFIIAESIINGH